MMLHFLTPLLCLVIMTAHSHAADSFIKAYPSGRNSTLTTANISKPTLGKKLYKVEGYAIKPTPLVRPFIITKAASSRPILQEKTASNKAVK